MQNSNNKIKINLSICIPTYNRLNTLKEALESVLNLKDLNTINYEIIISDDSNNDETEKYLKSLKNSKVRYFKNRIKGQFNSLNNLVEKARYEWILFLHDDDLLSPNYLQKTLHFTKDNLGIEIIWTGREFVGNDGIKLRDYIAKRSKLGECIILSHKELMDNVNYGGYAGGSKYVGMMVTGLMIKKTIVKKVGSFDPSIPVNADGLFLNKTQFLANKAVYINLPLVKYRMIDDTQRGKPSQEGIIYQEMVKVMNKTLDFVQNYLTKDEYLHEKNLYEKIFYNNVFIVNGPLLWTALRFKGTYLERLRLQKGMIEDVLNKFPITLLYPKSLMVLIASFFPQPILRRAYNLYLNFL